MTEDQQHLPGLAPDRKTTTWVYFAIRGGLFKIGYSKHPAERARKLNLVVLRTWPGARPEERWLQRRYRAFRVDDRHEYFYPNPQMMELLSVPDLRDLGCPTHW